MSSSSTGGRWFSASCCYPCLRDFINSRVTLIGRHHHLHRVDIKRLPQISHNRPINSLCVYVPTHLGPALDAIALVQHEPGVPAVSVNRHRVPLVQQNRFVGAHFPGPRTAIEPANGGDDGELIQESIFADHFYGQLKYSGPI